MSWKDSGIGGEFLFIEDRQLLLFCNTAESPVIAETGAIDFSWYVNRIYRPLAKKFEVSALELSID